VQNDLTVFDLFLFLQLFLRYLNPHDYKFHYDRANEGSELE